MIELFVREWAGGFREELNDFSGFRKRARHVRFLGGKRVDSLLNSGTTVTRADRSCEAGPLHLRHPDHHQICWNRRLDQVSRSGESGFRRNQTGTGDRSARRSVGNHRQFGRCVYIERDNCFVAGMIDRWQPVSCPIRPVVAKRAPTTFRRFGNNQSISRFAMVLDEHANFRAIFRNERNANSGAIAYVRTRILANLHAVDRHLHEVEHECVHRHSAPHRDHRTRFNHFAGFRQRDVEGVVPDVDTRAVRMQAVGCNIGRHLYWCDWRR